MCCVIIKLFYLFSVFVLITVVNLVLLEQHKSTHCHVSPQVHLGRSVDIACVVANL